MRLSASLVGADVKHDDEMSSEPAAANMSGADPRGPTRELVMQFESLGGRGLGCEFGMFQREFGAEPLGLLRWADMPYEGLISVLENRFEGIGAAEHTEVFVNRENSRPEYCTVDRRGFMFMRAFVYEDEMSPARMEKQALRRLTFLREKLIGDLETGSKILVYRLTDRNLTTDELERLHRAVRSYGDNTLLTGYMCPFKARSSLPVAASHKRMSPSRLHKARHFPSGANTGPNPTSFSGISCNNSPDFRSHNLITSLRLTSSKFASAFSASDETFLRYLMSSSSKFSSTGSSLLPVIVCQEFISAESLT